MKIIKTKFKDLFIVKQMSFKDKRGYLRVSYNKKLLGIANFVFEYFTNSKKNSLRGFHFQHKFQQAKYVTVIKGKILDYVIDLRKNSKTFGKIFKIVLSEKNNLGLFIPKGFAHAYYSYDKENIIYYKLTNYYNPEFEDGINLLDNEINARWPKKKFLISKKDKNLKTFKSFKKIYKYL